MDSQPRGTLTPSTKRLYHNGRQLRRSGRKYPVASPLISKIACCSLRVRKEGRPKRGSNSVFRTCHVESMLVITSGARRTKVYVVLHWMHCASKIFVEHCDLSSLQCLLGRCGHLVVDHDWWSRVFFSWFGSGFISTS